MIEIVKRNNAFFRQALFIVILAGMGAVMASQLLFFLGAFLGAFTFYVVCRRLLFWLTERHRWRPWMAAVAIVSVISVLMLAVGVLVGEIIASHVASVDTAGLIAAAKEIVPKINGTVGFTLISTDMIQASTAVLTSVANAVLNTAYSFAANIFMTVIVLYFMLVHAREMEAAISKYIPFRGESRAELLTDITSVVYSNAIGIPLTMMAQGLTAGVIYWAFGVPNVAFWAFLTALCGLVPMVGTVIVSVPIGIWMVASGQIWQGILMMACGVLIIANVDNLARIVLNQKISNTHPLIVIFGVILGIPLFGFWGIIFGPLMISVFLLLVKIYYKEYSLNETASGDGSETDLEAARSNDGLDDGGHQRVP